MGHLGRVAVGWLAASLVAEGAASVCAAEGRRLPSQRRALPRDAPPLLGGDRGNSSVGWVPRCGGQGFRVQVGLGVTYARQDPQDCHLVDSLCVADPELHRLRRLRSHDPPPLLARLLRSSWPSPSTNRRSCHLSRRSLRGARTMFRLAVRRLPQQKVLTRLFAQGQSPDRRTARQYHPARPLRHRRAS